MAAAFLKGETDLSTAVGGISDEGKSYVLEGVCAVLVHNIRLAQTAANQDRNELALKGIRTIKSDQRAVQAISTRVKNIGDTFVAAYQQNVQILYQQTKARFDEAVQRVNPANPSAIDVDSMPEFQQELRGAVNQFVAQYELALEEQKALLLNVS